MFNATVCRQARVNMWFNRHRHPVVECEVIKTSDRGYNDIIAREKKKSAVSRLLRFRWANERDVSR